MSNMVGGQIPTVSCAMYKSPSTTSLNLNPRVNDK